jgi:hypothetical protein
MIHVFAYADDRRVMPFGLEYDRHSWGGPLGGVEFQLGRCAG